MIPKIKKRTYLGNPNLKKIGVQIQFTQEQIDEYLKCADDPVYFATKYIKIVNVDRGLVPFAMWPFQQDMLQKFHDNRFVICKMPRQVGKSTTIIAHLLHQLLFRDRTNIAMLANKGSTARELLARLKLAYENIPQWMQQGVVVWNKGNIELENGSKALAAATSSSAVRGDSFNIIFLDEFAFVPNNQADQFFASVYPTITSGTSTQVLIVSTPNGLNKFYRMWKDASEGRSTYVPVEVHWSAVPGRDEAWKKETISNTSEEQFRAEFETEFIGSSNTLISGAKLRTMAFGTPFMSDNGTDTYELPKEGHTYAIMVDVARGQGQDYSAFSVIDVTDIPYKQVAKYRDNNIAPLVYPTIVHQAARLYKDAFILVEISDIGQQIADILHYELEYENLVKIAVKGKMGQQISQGHVKRTAMGIKTSTATKRIGCSNLKTLVEQDKLLIQDADTIMELTTFTAQKESFRAEEGNHDDLAMTLVLFGWFVAQRAFKDSMKDDIRRVLQKEQMDILDEDILPFGFMDDGINEHDDDGVNRWFEGRMKAYPLDSPYYDWNDKLAQDVRSRSKDGKS